VPVSEKKPLNSQLHWISRVIVFIFCVAPISITGLQAQTGQGALNGRVTDSNGAVIQKARVEIVNNATQVDLSSVTNSDGLYTVQSLNPGTYTVKVTSTGFESQQVSMVNVAAAQTTVIDVTLKPGQASETVVVTAEDTLLSAGTSDVTTTVDHSIVQNLPYPERSALEAVLLVPGVTGDPSVPGGIFSENPVMTTGPVVPGASISVGGAPPGTSSIMVDGSDITQASYARTGMNLSGEVVEETTVITSGVSARYGRLGGGVIVQTSKSGTDQIHGSVTWRHTDPFANAWPLGTTAPSDLHENYFGAYAGGPVKLPWISRGKNKTFFFVGFEPARMSNKQGYRGQFDTPADLTGYLHNSISLLNQTILKNSGYAAAIAAPRVGGIYPNSTVNAQGFPNGKIGSASPNPQETGPGTDGCSAADGGLVGGYCIDDVSPVLKNNAFARYITSQLPTPSNPGPYIQFDNAQGTYDASGNNASYLRGVVNHDNRYSFRIDRQFGNGDRVFGRYSVVPLSGPRYFALAISNPVNQVPTDTIGAHNLALGYTHVVKNSLVNDFHYSFLRVVQNRTPPLSALSQDFAAKNGLTPATLGMGFPNLGTLGSSTLQIAAASAYEDIDQNFIAGDALTWTKGNHLFEFGGDVRWIQSNQYDTSLEYGGKYSFSAQMTNTTGTSGGSGGNALATLILGDIYSYQAAPVAVPGYYRWRYYSGYAMDDWRVLPNLTLNLGVRYEVELPRAEKFNRQALMVSSSLANPATAQFCFAGSCGLGQRLWPTNWRGIEPRLGISYAPTGKTTIRTSYGIVRMPLTGYENQPDPDFNIASTTVGNQTGGAIAGQIVNYMTNPVPALTSAYTALGGSQGPFTASQGLNPVYVNQSSTVPYIQSWNLTVQYQPTTRDLVQLTYHGIKGTHLIGSFGGTNSSYANPLNIPTLSTIIANVQAGVNLAGTASGVTSGVNGVTGETVLQALNPYYGFSQVTLLEIYPRHGASSYNAFYANWGHNYSHGLSLRAYYAWSKSLDNVPDTDSGNSGDFGTAPPQDPHSTVNEWSVSSYDEPSTLKGGYQYDLPFGAGKAIHFRSHLLNVLAGDISTAGIFGLQSGFPNFVMLNTAGYFTSFTPKGASPTPIGAAAGVTAPACTATYCASSALPAGYYLRPNVVPGVPLINPAWKQNPFGLNGGAFTPYLNPAAFTVPGSLGNPALGNEPRTLSGARSPREFTFDMRAVKGFSIKERYQLRLVAAAHNVFNHPVYFAANQTAGDPLLSSQTNVTTGSGAPSITFNQNSTSFGHLNPNSSSISRIVRLGVEFTF
jgi:hypothetical protein